MTQDTPTPDGAVRPVDADSVELLYTPSESIFAAVAPLMVSLGWSVFPQETAGERRMPGKVNGQSIKWAEEHDLKNRLPTSAALALWCHQCAPLNVACVFGPASGDTFAVDIDVTDEAMVEDIVSLAEEILGHTPLRREGRAPKIALIYRHPPGEAGRVPSLSRMFAQIDEHGNADRSEHGIEILSEGKLITFHGRHHKTGNYFKWLEANPLMVGPEAAPLVTPDQVQTFLEAVDARWRFHRGAAFSAEGATWQWDETSSMMVPRLALAAGGSAWSEDANGLVNDGREQYLSHLVYRTVTGNHQTLVAAHERGDEAVKRFKQDCAVAVVNTFQSTAVMDGRWRLASLRHEVTDKVNRIVDKALSGRLSIRRRTATAGGDSTFVMPLKEGGTSKRTEASAGAPPGEPLGDPEFGFLPPNKPGARKPLKGRVAAPVPGAESLAIPEDRTPIMGEIQQKLEGALRAFFADVYGAPEGHGPERRCRVHILRAPTGAGKTSRGIRFVAADPRTYEDYEFNDDGEPRVGRAPLVFLLPTYANIDELRHRAQVLGLDPNLPDAELRAEATRLGLIHEDELEGRLAELRRDAIDCGLVTMVYQGKIRAGCAMADKVSMAMAAGISTASFCKATRRVKQDPDDKDEIGELVEEFCSAYHECGAIQQRKRISECHVVFLPHSFLSLSIPEELQDVRAVVADERIHHLFLHTDTFPSASLTRGRKPPRLTKREKAEGERTAEELLADRNKAAEIAIDALIYGSCPAEALIEYRNNNASGPDYLYPGPLYVQSALRVCGAAIQRDANLSPSTSIEEVRAMCAQPTGQDVRQEWRFWKIIEERIAALGDRLRDAMVANSRERLAASSDPLERVGLERSLARMSILPDKASGATDARIQYLTDHTTNGGSSTQIRISWRTDPNWLGRPMLLLDASAAPPIVAKIWKLPEEDIVVHDIVADIGRALNVKTVAVANQTFSNASLIASPSASLAECAVSARNLANVRRALTTVASLYGDGRVVAGASIVLRQVLNNNWAAPDNVDWCHYGALRGLDMFKYHAAAFSVGRMEVPVRTIDGLVAALTYDDPVPEPPFDRFGTGLDPEGQSLRLPMVDQRIRLRDGHVALVPAPMYPGRWARLIQRQYREEETLQFVGRLRPVYREGRTPVWFCLSSVVPEEIIVDEIIHIDDLVSPARLSEVFEPSVRPPRLPEVWEASRLFDGVISPEVMAHRFREGWFENKEGQSFAREAAARIEALGFDLETGARLSRAARGYVAMRWMPPASDDPASDKPRIAFVRASVPNHEERLRAALETMGTKFSPYIPRSVELLEAPAPSMARKRASDKVDDGIGPSEQRAAREANAAGTYGSKMMEVPRQKGVNDTQFFVVETRLLGCGEVSALRAIETHWAAKGGGADDRVMPLVPDAPAEVVEGIDYVDYDQLAAGFQDDDSGQPS